MPCGGVLGGPLRGTATLASAGVGSVSSSVVGCGVSPATRGADVAEEVRAEMVANVWKVVVNEGDTVEDGDTLVILESMKMEIPVISEAAGRVTALAVGEGDVVQEGDLIATIE
jgi:acetyl-CoA carboxylase biotin carboxyl carrier protein